MPYFLPFQSPRIATIAFDAMRGASIGGLKFQLGLITSHFRANFPLKSCPECMFIDRIEYGSTYWRRSHQLPGTWLCLEHDQPLLESTLKSTSASRFNWVLPDESHLRSVVDKSDHKKSDRLKQLAVSNKFLINLPEGWYFDTATLARTMNRKLFLNNLSSDSGRLKTKEIGASFFDFIVPICSVEDFHAVGQSLSIATTQACGYFHRLQKITHPLRHIFMINWLFGDWVKFISAYHQEVADFSHEQEPISQKSITQNSGSNKSVACFTKTCEHFFKVENLSANAIGAKLGVTISTVINHLSKVGIHTPRRPKLLKAEKAIELRKILLKGIAKKEAASMSGISIQTVTKFLISEAGLYTRWRQLIFSQTQQENRDSWADLLSGNQSASIKLLRSIEPKTFTWLYRNDRAWLEEKNTTRLIPSQSIGRSVDWATRDKDMAALVRTNFDKVLNVKSEKRIPVTELLRRIPTLKPYINKLDFLPSTQKLLYQYIVRKKKLKDDLLSNQ
jgi:hypothetical protein